MIERINWMQAQELVDLGTPRESEVVYADVNDYENCLPALSLGEIIQRLNTAFDLTYTDQKYHATCISKLSQTRLKGYGDSTLDAVCNLYKAFLLDTELQKQVSLTLRYVERA